MSLQLTRLLSFFYDAPNNAGAQENRGTNDALLRLFQRQTPEMINSAVLEAVQGSKSRPRNIPVFVDTYSGADIGSTISCTPTAGSQTTANLPITLTPYSFTITMRKHEWANNHLAEAQAFTQQFEGKIRELKKAIEGQCASALNTNRNQVWTTATPPGYTVTGNAIRVPVASQNRFFNDLIAVFGANDFQEDAIDVVSNYGVMPIASFWQNQGAANAQNTGFAFNPYRGFNYNSRIGQDANAIGTGFAVPPGVLGLTHWVEPNFDAPTTELSRPVDFFKTSIPSLPGIEFGVLYKAECAEPRVSGSPNSDDSNTPFLQETWQFQTNIATFTAFNSDLTTRVNPIIKFAFNNA